MYQDKTLVCEDCSQEFTFTAGQAEFFAQKGFSDPKRCETCRRNRKLQNRQVFQVTCADCGTDTTVPFKPVTEKPVYCRDCFVKQKAGAAA